MKKFSQILENIGNVYQEGTPFSNGHRSRRNRDGFLLDRHNMIDIDEVIFDDTGKIWAILENKKRTPGPQSKLPNILTTTTTQKLALTELCKLLDCHFFVQLELENKYHLIDNLSVKTTYSKQKFEDTIKERNYTRLKSDNLIFVEFRVYSSNINFKAIVTRVSESSPEIKNLAKSISNSLGVTNVEVDDSGDFIKFFSNGKFIGRVKSILDPTSLTPNMREYIEKGWVWIYKQMGIFN